MINDQEIDRSKLRYVLYARKSTEDEGSQVRTHKDQIKHCEKLAERAGLNIVATFKESKSAKKADNRPVFNRILEDIKHNNKYDAILAFAPDRLSRNMLEGGLLINMLDEGILKDLQFPTHHFTNNPSGKLTLGIMFSISKHFSDDLSRKVQTGVSGNFDDGRSSGSPKWGYVRDEQDGLYRPSEWFDTIQEAWHLRAGEATNKVVLEFLLEKGYHRMTKITKKNKKKRRINPTEKSVGNMFQDPFYYGILEQANQTIDLRTVYGFEPMIEEDLYNQVQSLAYSRKRDTNPKKMLEFKSYRCDTKGCKRSPKSVRAKFVFEEIYTLLEKLELSDEAYERYNKRIVNFTDEKIIKIKSQIASKRGAYSHKKKELDELPLGLPKIKRSSPAYEINEKQINKLKDKIANPSKIKLTKEQFLNLIRLAPNKMRAGSAVEKDRVARILFLNLSLDNEKRLSVIWKEPSASLIKAIEMSSGVPGRI